MSTHEVAQKAAEYSLSKKSHGVILMDLKKITSMTDYFLICHGDSDVHVKAIANAVIDGLRQEGQKPWHIEGMSHLNWVLLDYVDFVVHIFQKEAREYYGIERLWSDAGIEKFKENA